ncbi:unnamed protein product [Psylliodes chrysocephalus]|uniref:Uncharacterized protein n=1 Tax=Psylliodes chrysocephalus TaxID=3402493 RepID=A0A9P0GD73_9CUCU|nr:unnamed protein product [Psylliodes chrysocephala]
MRLDRLLVLVIVCSVNAKNQTDEVISTKETFNKLELQDCVNSDSIVSCLASKAASEIEHSMNKNIPLFGDVKLLRNNEKIFSRRGRALDGVDRFFRAVSDFIDTHTFSIDLTNSSARALDEDEDDDKELPKRGGGGGGGGGGFGGGIFGLTGPLVMKILGIMAAKSLLAAKAALIIVGSVALKKLFENNHHEKPKIKVTTVPIHEEDDEHDRLSYSFNHIPYGYASYGFSPYYHEPYSAHHPGNSISDNNDFEPVLYGKKAVS